MCASSRRLGYRPWVPVLAGSVALVFTVSLLTYLVLGPLTITDILPIDIHPIWTDGDTVNPPVVATDPAFYQHVGWYMTQGAVPYVDIWDVNPPLTFTLAALLAIVAGGNLLVQHALSVVMTFAAVGGAIALTAWLAYDLTGDDAATMAATGTMLLLPEIYGIPPYGLRSQFFALVFGVLALVLVRRSRPFAAGASAMAAAGFWQPGGAMVFLVAGMAAHRRGWPGALRSVGGSLTVAVLVALPFLMAGAFEPMVIQTVIAPLYVQAPYTLLGRTFHLALIFGYGIVLVPVAIAGWGVTVVESRTHWWVPAGGLLYGLQMYVVNLNGALDAVLFLVFVSLGVAVAVTVLPWDRRRWATAIIALLVVAGPIWHVVPTPYRQTIETGYDRTAADSTRALVTDDRNPSDMQAIYWQKRTPTSCHYRLSHTELRWIAQTKATVHERTCGTWPG